MKHAGRRLLAFARARGEAVKHAGHSAAAEEEGRRGRDDKGAALTWAGHGQRGTRAPVRSMRPCYLLGLQFEASPSELPIRPAHTY